MSGDTNSVEYWLHWRFAVCAVWVLCPMMIWKNEGPTRHSDETDKAGRGTATSHGGRASRACIRPGFLHFRFPWFRIAYFLLFTGIFVIFQWIVHASVSMWWPYPFLDLSSPLSPVWYLIVALLHLPCYAVFPLIMKLTVMYCEFLTRTSEV